MLKAAIVSTVDFCIRFAYLTIALALLIGGFAVYYAGDHFAINTDITKVFSKDIAWRQREVEFDKLLRSAPSCLSLFVSLSWMLILCLHVRIPQPHDEAGNENTREANEKRNVAYLWTTLEDDEVDVGGWLMRVQDSIGGVE